MHLQRRLVLLELSSARPAAPEPLELRGGFFRHHFPTRALLPRRCSLPTQRGRARWHRDLASRHGPHHGLSQQRQQRRGDLSPSGHLCTHFEVPTLSGYAALRPAAWPCCPQRRQEREQGDAAWLYRSCRLLGYCKEQGRGDQGASAGGPCQQGLANSETSLHEVDQGHPNPSMV